MGTDIPQPNLDLKDYITQVVVALLEARRDINKINDDRVRKHTEKISISEVIDFEISLSVIEASNGKAGIAVRTIIVSGDGSGTVSHETNSTGTVKFSMVFKDDDLSLYGA